MPSNIHSTCILGNNLQIETGVSIGPFSIIGDNVCIGKNTTIASNVLIASNVTIGNDNVLGSGICLGTPPQDRKFRHNPLHSTSITIGHRNILHEHITIHAGTQQSTLIGNDNYLMAQTHIAHDSKVGDHNTLCNNSILGGWSILNNNVFVSACVVIEPKITIGNGAFIAANTRIAKDVFPFSKIASARATLLGFNIPGLYLLEKNPEKQKQLKHIFDIFFYQTKNMLVHEKIQELQRLKREGNFHLAKMELYQWIETAKRSEKGWVQPLYKKQSTSKGNQKILIVDH